MCVESGRGEETENELIRFKFVSLLLFLIVYPIVNVVSRAIVRTIPVLGDRAIGISNIERAQSQKCSFLEQQAEQFFGRLGGVEDNSLSAIVAAMCEDGRSHGPFLTMLILVFLPQVELEIG
jgi:hypothetical protein